MDDAILDSQGNPLEVGDSIRVFDYWAHWKDGETVEFQSVNAHGHYVGRRLDNGSLRVDRYAIKVSEL